MTRARSAFVAGALLLLALGTWLILANRPVVIGAESPQAAVERFYDALGRKDSAAACALMASDAAPLVGDEVTLCRSGFDTALGQVATPDELAALRSARVSGAQVDGDRATVRADQITGVPTAYQNAVSLVRVDGHWLIETPR